MNMKIDSEETVDPGEGASIVTSQVFGVVVAAFSTLRLLLDVAQKLAAPSLRDLVIFNALLQRLESTLKTTRKELAARIEEKLGEEGAHDWGSVKVTRSADRVKIVPNADAALAACEEAGLDPEASGLVTATKTYEVVPEVVEQLLAEGVLTPEQGALILKEKTTRGKLTCTLSKDSKAQVDEILAMAR